MKHTNRSKFQTIQEIQNFVYAGNSTFTLHNKLKNTHVTFRIKKPKGRMDDPTAISFVLFKSDKSYYLGYIPANRNYFIYGGQKATMDKTSIAVKSFNWFFNKLRTNTLDLSKIDVYHEGYCGRCGRQLTQPNSIKLGMGPSCMKRNENESKATGSKITQLSLSY